MRETGRPKKFDRVSEGVSTPNAADSSKGRHWTTWPSFVDSQTTASPTLETKKLSHVGKLCMVKAYYGHESNSSGEGFRGTLNSSHSESGGNEMTISPPYGELESTCILG